MRTGRIYHKDRFERIIGRLSVGAMYIIAPFVFLHWERVITVRFCPLSGYRDQSM